MDQHEHPVTADATAVKELLLEALPEARVVAWAPGRVNLIGEHTDYNGFPVLPMAIDRRVWVAAAPLREGVLRIRNLDDANYPAEAIALEQLPHRSPRQCWTDYVVAAARACAPTHGWELLVAGDVPPEAGLSSSSALVVASMLALVSAADRFQLAERARLAERYVGTLSGGMDQAIALLAQPGCASLVEFRPLRVQPVPLPDGLGIVVAHSGVAAAKSGAARAGYNERVRQCRQAARLLGATGQGLLADVPGCYTERLERARKLRDPVLRRRAQFVYAEARRVGQAVRALRQADLVRLGELINASHEGLRTQYEVSHPAADALVQRARAAGALGARVVGAGFGGCIVAVCPADAAPELACTLGPRAWVFRPVGPAERQQRGHGLRAWTRDPSGGG